MSCNGSAETVNLKTEETQIENKNLDVEEGEVKQTSEEIEVVDIIMDITYICCGFFIKR